MKCSVFNETGDNLLRIEQRQPVCGEDFCDHCGDCLACFGGEPCGVENATHVWVVYEDSPTLSNARSEEL
jgi:hypothetical protein